MRNSYVLTWSGQECSSHTNLYLCALFYLVIVNKLIKVKNKLELNSFDCN